ncbi:hypothetical protein A4D02_22130 [Niastella koreensis]|uniref:Uncharacterized protein n=2 Tax=Niastella koreensis TaxID=354356 RepID=G8TGK9_NIAKG|nr:hypothetical protein [Niastella koreensis]AEV98451.1 hypothetical protein Niako_2096 [Niastella koreensis GR20-10]OQP53103.1 hypothetical protein A4D02_22130 [Niastella koreensis]
MKPAARNQVIALLLSVIFSCNKPGNNIDNTPADPYATNLHLSKVVQTADGATNGKSSVLEFVYAADQRRIDHINYAEGDLATNTTKTIQTYQCYYNGTDTLAYSASGKPPANSSYSANMYYRYNSAGKVMYDSAKSTSSNELTIRQYIISSGGILAKKSYYANGSTIATSVEYDNYVIKANNITEATFDDKSGNPIPTIRCIYDNKINPVYTLTLTAWTPVDGLAGAFSYLAPGASKNNIVQCIMGYTDAQGIFKAQQTNYFTYTYNKDGLPEKCTIKTPTGNYTVNYYYETH